MIIIRTGCWAWSYPPLARIIVRVPVAQGRWLAELLFAHAYPKPCVQLSQALKLDQETAQSHSVCSCSLANEAGKTIHTTH